MVLTETPICDFGLKAPGFELQDCFGNTISQDQVKGEKGLLVLFICNHCPYVKAIFPRLNQELSQVQNLGIGVVAINSNDVDEYPEDSPERMKEIAQKYDFSFPYCFDPTQAVARDFGAVCTPDFFGYNSNLRLQYRGRLDDCGRNPPREDMKHELLDAMKLVAETGQGPKQQIASMGCSIKWKD